MPALSTARLSDELLVVAVLLYASAMLGFAITHASRRRAVRVETLRVAGDDDGRGTPLTGAGWTGQFGLGLVVAGAVTHLVSLILRGVAAGRVPWGNMYEFSSAVAWIGALAFVLLVVRQRIEAALGVYVMVPLVLYLGIASTVLYTPAGPLVPALASYWLKIHVAAAVLATGCFLLSGVLAVLYLVRSSARVSAGSTRRQTRLPEADTLDGVCLALISFAFPVWTFAIAAGAIWAESAWGRYWGWDPKETWSFITWVLYAGYLHARATGGWRGRRAAWVAVAAAAALIVDYYVVNIFVVGLHSYA